MNQTAQQAERARLSAHRTTLSKAMGKCDVRIKYVAELRFRHCRHYLRAKPIRFQSFDNKPRTTHVLVLVDGQELSIELASIESVELLET